MALLPSYPINFTDPLSGKFIVPSLTTNGTLFPTLSSLPSSSASASTSIMIYGKGSPNYGERLQESIIHILESFYGSTEPLNATSGQLWYASIHYWFNSTSSSFFRYDDTTQTWTNITSDVDSSANNPIGSPVSQTHHYNNSTTTLFLWNAEFSVWQPRLYKISSSNPSNGVDFPLKELLVCHNKSLSTLQIGNSYSPQWVSITSGYVHISGDTLTGYLILHADPTIPMHPVTKQYADGLVAFTPIGNILATTLENAVIELDNEKVAKSGDIMTGNLTITNVAPILAFIETDATAPAGRWRFRADDAIFRIERSTSGDFGSVVSPMIVGNTQLQLGSNETSSFGLEIGNTSGGISTTPYLDFHTSTTNVDYNVRLIASGAAAGLGAGTLTINATGGIVSTGAITLPADPTLGLHAATKQYVDNEILTASTTSTTVSRVVQASSGSALYTLPSSMQYIVGSDTLWIFVNGIKYLTTTQGRQEIQLTSAPLLTDPTGLFHQDTIIDVQGVREIFEIHQPLTIVDIDQPVGDDNFVVSGDKRAYFQTGYSIVVSGSAGNDGTYTISTNSTYDSLNNETSIYVASIPSGTAGGTVALNYPGAFLVYGDVEDFIGSSDVFTILGSTGNNGSYTTISGSLNMYHTPLNVSLVAVTSALPSLVADGYIQDASYAFVVAGDQTALYPANSALYVHGSTTPYGTNDGAYNITSSSFSGGNTTIIVSTVIDFAWNNLVYNGFIGPVRVSNVTTDGGTADGMSVLTPKPTATTFSAVTYSDLLNTLNADLSPVASAYLDGNRIVIQSNSFGATSSIVIADTDAFNTLPLFSALPLFSSYLPSENGIGGGYTENGTIGNPSTSITFTPALPIGQTIEFLKIT